VTEFVYLTRDDVIAYHIAEFRRRGVSPAPVISEEKLQAAIERPKQSAFGEDAYPTLGEKATALMQALVTGHPFMDGNKRIGLASCLLFLELNGMLQLADNDALADLTLAVATGELREVSEIAGRLRALFPALAERDARDTAG
jgi:death-on-curing protein